MPKLGNHILQKDQFINLEFAEYGIKSFFTTCKKPAIRFFSAGEPTIAFERMVEIYSIAKKIAGDDLTVELQTNGFFSGAIADWIEKHINIIWISFDGPPEIQDKQRPTVQGGPSSMVLLDNIKRFTENRKIQFGIRTTILEENFNKQIELIHYFKSIGVKFVCGAPAYNSEVNKSISKPNLLKFAENFALAYIEAIKIGIFYQTHLIVNFDENVVCYCRACSTPPCPQLTSDGYVSCCDWASFGPEYLPGVLQDCIFGRWNQSKKQIDFFEKKKKQIEDRNTTFLRMSSCANCDIIDNCAGGCIGKIIVNSKSLDKMDVNWCEAVRYLKKHLPKPKKLFPVLHS